MHSLVNRLEQDLLNFPGIWPSSLVWESSPFIMTSFFNNGRQRVGVQDIAQTQAAGGILQVTSASSLLTCKEKIVSIDSTMSQKLFGVDKFCSSAVVHYLTIVCFN